MSWLCLFRPCEWWFLGNVPNTRRQGAYGLYQCCRCKTVSLGSPKG